MVGKKANNGLIALRGSSPLSSRSPRYSPLFPTKEPGPRLRTRSRDEKMVSYEDKVTVSASLINILFPEVS